MTTEKRLKTAYEIYKGFKIEAEIEMSLGGDELLYYSVFRESDGWELQSGFTRGTEKIEQMIKMLKDHVDDYLENPGDYNEP